MGFYLRKSFKAGPVRLNLSKSGLGVSTGVKGLRVGAGPKGNYVHAGRGGLYYRKSLGSKGRRPSSDSLNSIPPILGLIVLIVTIIFLFKVVNWFRENPIVFYGLVAVVLAVAFYVWYKLSQLKRNQSTYKNDLDSIFVLNNEAPNKDRIDHLKQLREKISGHESLDSKLSIVENNVYKAVLDKIIDDRLITQTEKEQIEALEQVIKLPDPDILDIKKELFSSFYLDAIADTMITQDESKSLNNIIEGLRLPRKEIINEIKIINEIVKAQKLSIPLTPIETTNIKLQKSETPYYEGTGRVLSRRKAKKSSEDDYEYTILRDGKLVITDKRVMVIKEGTSTLKLSDILDIDVNVDERFIIASKNTSSRPFILETKEPFYCGRIIDLLSSELA